MKLFRLKFRSALHVDSRGSGEPESAEEFVRSDTLSAALALAWAALFPEDAPGVFSDPPFKVSSAFPYAGSTLLFPAPAWNIWRQTDRLQPQGSKNAHEAGAQSLQIRKDLKKVRWLSRPVFEQVLQGGRIDWEEVELLPGGIAVSSKELHGTELLGSGALPWVLSERQRVSVDRLGVPGGEGLFFFALQFFAPDAGLFFLADAAKGQDARLRAALDFLGDQGLGADRSSGLGSFEVRSEEEFEPFAATGKGWVTLSLYNPDPKEDLQGLTAKTAYGLTTRAGWIHQSTLGRPPIRAFTEGSYFSLRPEGRIVPMLDQTLITELRQSLNLRIGHSAPRDFRAFAVPCSEPPELMEVES